MGPRSLGFHEHLYGHDAIFWRQGASGEIEAVRGRHPDGFFGAPSQWRNQTVAGVLHVNQLQPYRLQHAEVTLWPHPAASQLTDLGTRIPATVIHYADGRLVTSRSAADAADHFGLPDPWPVGNPFPES